MITALEGLATLLTGVTATASLPFLPAFAELWHQNDATELHIAQDYVKDPRFFAKSFRKKLEELTASAAGQPLPYKTVLKMRKAEDFLVDSELRRTSKTGYQGIAVSLGDAHFANDTGSHDLWIQGRADIGDRFRVWTLAVDGDAVMGEKCRVSRWIDSGGSLTIGPGTQLGQSASAVDVMLLSDGVKFTRLFANPIVVAESETPSAPASLDPLIGDHAFTDDGGGLCFPNGCTIDHDIICRGNLRIGSATTVTADIKSHGDITIGGRTEIKGNVIARGSVEIGDDCTIHGNVFAEKGVSVGRRSTVGTFDFAKSIYAAGKIVLRGGVRVHGAVITERGGLVKDAGSTVATAESGRER